MRRESLRRSGFEEPSWNAWIMVVPDVADYGAPPSPGGMPAVPPEVLFGQVPAAGLSAAIFLVSRHLSGPAGLTGGDLPKRISATIPVAKPGEPRV